MKFAMYGRTTFVIAHRLSTVRAADMVIVLEHGRVTQVGTHNELMKQPGHYRDIAVAQLYGDAHVFDDERPSHMDRVQNPRAFEEAAEKDAEEPDAPSLTVARSSNRAPQ
jgi:ABC-type sulfate/molybdate transport systems ATPase subunit